MSKAFKRVWREIALLWRYSRDVGKHWKIILGSTVVAVLLWFTKDYGTNLLIKAISVAPELLIPWLTKNRLIVLSIVFVLSVAQYLAWRELRLAADSEQPDLDRLKLLQEDPGPNAPQSQPWPAYYLILLFEVTGEIKPPIVVIEGTDAIHKASADHQREGISRPSCGLEHPRYNRIRAEFSAAALSRGDKLRVVLHSPSPIRLKTAGAGEP